MQNIKLAIVAALLSVGLYGSSISGGSSGLGSVALVNQTPGSTGAGAGSLTITIPAAAVGNKLVVFFTNQSTNTATGVTCANVTFTQLAGNSLVRNSEIWSGTVVGGSSGTSVVISVTGLINISGIVAEFSSTAGWGLSDGGIGNGGTGFSGTTAAYSNTGRDLILTCVGTAANAAQTISSPGGIFTDLPIVNFSVANLLASYGVATAGAQSASWNFGQNAAWASVIGGLGIGAGATTGDLHSRSWAGQ